MRHHDLIFTLTVKRPDGGETRSTVAFRSDALSDRERDEVDGHMTATAVYPDYREFALHSDDEADLALQSVAGGVFLVKALLLERRMNRLLRELIDTVKGATRP